MFAATLLACCVHVGLIFLGAHSMNRGDTRFVLHVGVAVLCECCEKRIAGAFQLVCFIVGCKEKR